MIRLDKINKIYKSNNIEVKALDDVSLILPDKGLISIFGSSGCGKSTLLNVLGGLDSITSGKIIYNGKDVAKYSEKEWDKFRNQEVGFIFQNYYLLPHLNIFDNIKVTLELSKDENNVENRIKEVLDVVELSNFEKRYPNTLSGGQKQRVAIARALIANPTIILADEPTGALDRKNSIIVMEMLKKLSENHLVIMVTHNEKLAKQYSDRLIEISYGKIISDTSPIKKAKYKNKKEELKDVHLPLKTNIKWGLKNVIKKKSRSIPIMIASAIGLASVGIVLSLTVGINNYTLKAQEASLGEYPVYVTCYPKNSSEGHAEELEEYPDIDEIIVEKSDYYETEHYVSMQEDFMDYMNEMDESYYSLKDSNSSIAFPLIAYNGVDYVSVSSTSRFSRIAPSDKNYNFILNQYDILYGHLPENINEVVLVIDTYNRVDLTILDSLGFLTSNDTISFSDILNKEYHTISLDDYYIYNDINNRYYRASSLEDLYKIKTDLVLKISGIIREKENSFSSLFSPGILYHPTLTDYIKNKSRRSEIIKRQLYYGLDMDVFSGNSFSDNYYGGYLYTANYQYESRLYSLGYEERITSLFYYTSTFADRTKIIDYFNAYINSKDSTIVFRSRDYLKQVTSSFSNMVSTFSSIILIFAFVSIVVSAILTAILTYISVLERQKEIGLLRSIGARKIDISMMFLCESFIIGTFAAILGSILIAALLPLAGQVVLGLIDFYGSSAISPTLSDIATFQWWVFPLVFISSILLSNLSSLIPAFIAGKKKPVDSLKE